MLRYRKFPTNKYGNRYKGKKYVHDEETIICYFCGKVGHITSKCSHLRKTESFNAFRTNQKGPNHGGTQQIWVPGQWLLTSHDRRKVYVPMFDPMHGGTVTFGRN